MNKSSVMAVATLVGLLVCGCAGELEDPAAFELGGGADAGAACGNEEAEVLLRSSCASGVCHDADAPAANLDLISPGFAERLIGHESSVCPPMTLLSDGDQSQGLFFDKLTGEIPDGCGGPMPLAAPLLADDEIECLRRWASGLSVP